MDWLYSKSQIIIELLNAHTESFKLHISIEKQSGRETEWENGGFQLCGGEINIKIWAGNLTKYISLFG